MVAAAVVAAATVTLRLVLTRERLIAFVLPRIEGAVGARVSVGDISIQFPFGFGVEIGELSFGKVLPDGSELSFSADKAVMKASLLSLVRRRPEIESAVVLGGSVGLSALERRPGVRLRGLEARASMRPVGDAFALDVELSVDSAALYAARGGAPVVFERIRFDGELEGDRDLEALRVVGSELVWDGLLSIRVSGEITGLRSSSDVRLEIVSEERALAPLVERLVSLNLPALLLPPAAVRSAAQGTDRTGGGTARPAPLALPVGVGGGTFSLEARVEGSLKDQSSVRASGTVGLKDIGLMHKALSRAVELNGSVDFTERRISSKGLELTLGKAEARVLFDIGLSGTRKPQTVDFSADLEADLADMLSTAGVKGFSAAGRLRAGLSGGGSTGVLAGLFPAAGKGSTAAGIQSAWRSVRLEGKASLDEAEFSAAGSPLRVSSLSASAEISGADVKNLEAEFSVNGSPFRCTASLEGILPAAAEFALLASERGRGREGRGVGDLGTVLDGMKSDPRIELQVAGGTLDLRPFEKKPAAQGAPEAAGEGRSEPGEGAVPGGKGLVPGAVLFLKRMSFKARLDSVVSRAAVFTGVDARGRALDGRIEMDPILLDYCGGRGRASIAADLRNPGRITTKVDLSFEGVEADRALGRLHSLGRLVRGSFTFQSSGELTLAPGVDPLSTMRAGGSALSRMGRVNFSNLISSAEGLGAPELARLGDFSFREWSGSFLVRDGRFITDDWKIRSGRGDWVLRGSFGFDGTLDYLARLVIPREAQKEMKDLDRYGGLLEFFRDARGDLVLDFKIGGTGKAPRVSLDMSGSARRASRGLVDDLKKRGAELLKADTTSTDALERAKEGLEKLKDLWGKKKK